MANYDTIPVDARRDRYDDMILSVYIPSGNPMLWNRTTNETVGVVACVFNTAMMQPVLENAIRTVAEIDAVTIYYNTGTDLSSNMTETAAAVNEIAANVQSIKVKVINQSASVTETNATMEQVVGNINKLNGHVENQSRDVSQASSASVKTGFETYAAHREPWFDVR
jgi:methyl-accepting chemotaxis protein